MARIVFNSVLGWDLAELEARRSEQLSGSEVLKVIAPLARLRNGEPLQYVLGHCWFMGLRLRVVPGVLIPRPETEEMVDHIVSTNREFHRILDVGTGSGCIALALKKRLPNALVVGIDVSDEALAIARDNGGTLGLSVQWIEQDVFDPGGTWPQHLDLVVSNPPYIPFSEHDSLDAHVRQYEPHLALFVGDADPLLFYRVIGQRAKEALVEGGALWFETHHHHAVDVGELLIAMGFHDVAVLQDLSGSARFIRCRR